MASLDEWTSFLHGDSTLKTVLTEHVQQACRTAKRTGQKPASYRRALDIAATVPEPNPDKPVQMDGAMSSSLALMILFSIKTGNCVWLYDQTLAIAIAQTAVTHHSPAAVLDRIRIAADDARLRDSAFSKPPKPYDDSNVNERERAIAVGTLCYIVHGSKIQELYTIVTG
jgi:hypothetical protein